VVGVGASVVGATVGTDVGGAGEVVGETGVLCEGLGDSQVTHQNQGGQNQTTLLTQVGVAVGLVALSVGTTDGGGVAVVSGWVSVGTAVAPFVPVGIGACV